MRELKFRAFDKIHGEMIYHFLLGSQNQYFDGKEIDFPVMQYTGLKDKNGKEIYEGDIIKRMLQGRKKRRQKDISFVEYDGYMCKYYLKQSDNDMPFGNDLVGPAIAWDNHEVIGNIYENPELLQ